METPVETLKEQEVPKEIAEALDAPAIVEEVAPIISVLCKGKFALMEHKIKPLTEVADKSSIEVLKEVEFKSESITGGFNPTLKEVFSAVQDDNEILTQAIAISVVKDSDKLDSSKLFKTAMARFYKLKA